MYQNTEPARYWQQQLVEWGPKVLFAILILIVTHFVAKAVQWAIAKLIDRVPILKRHPGVGGDSIGTELGRLAYWLVWLVGLIAALQPLGLSGVLTPVTALTNEVFAFLPRLLGAGLFFFAGLILARIVRHVVEAFLGALNLERLLGRAGLSIGEQPIAVDETGTASEGAAPARSSIARAVGVTVSAIIILFAAIGALQILQITAISDPATNMLNAIALAIPNVLAALVWLTLAFIIGRWVKSLLETVLPSLGFDNAVRALGVMPANAVPSRVVGTLAMTAAIIIGLMEAARQVGGDSTAALMLQVTELGGKVIFGTVIIVVGIFLARILSNLVGSSTGEAGYAQTIVKYAIIALFTAIGLTFMGLADQIVMMAFGLILGSAAIATALAFGLGGRDYAARVLEEWHEGTPPPSPRRPAPPPRLKKAPEPEDDSQPPLV
ncbi:mechanosensitive ion channel [Sphingomonas sp. NSE70-1]|uniref:Small-conductance mechanosensitive channel n=1 Tax=Sphingomonas caseinilyticus TaxID=2908205 RepID=A0ABT0RU09_9SPHN|nr:mechanosensitive ion channel [Sphingomonas caseinilyticus]MCL6698318.1 mechanosensitive ion channel [Sphingomonas caseinilyticus]